MSMSGMIQIIVHICRFLAKKRSFASFDDNPVIVIVSALLQLLPDRIPLDILILVHSCVLNNLLVSLSLLLLSISTLQSVNVKGH